jgi:hypothetical protein
VASLPLSPFPTSRCLLAETVDERFEFFEARIRPLLVEHCYECHNSVQTADGGLALDHRTALLKGGDGGPVLVPGKPAESRLLKIVRHEVPELKMPRGGAKLKPAALADIERWIAMGAPDPRDRPPTQAELAQVTAWETIFQQRKQWWSLQPVRSQPSPVVKATAWPGQPLDRFILANLEEHRLAPAARADNQTLLRRLTFTLTGLPPRPDEIAEFLGDVSPDAFERVVDRLLASPRYGERWARHWMDLVRYCESHGSQGDPELPNAYRYRDYLIRAFNGDVPYDQFVREQLAGDLTPNPRWNSLDQVNESAIGTAHLRMVELGFVPVDALDDQMKVVDNQIDVFSKAFLGLTVSCARCHHHKFDPISQEDFYALYGIFASSRPGQVLIDTPELLHKHRPELTRLKQQIRDELATAWLQSAADLPQRLQQQSQQETKLAELTLRVQQLQQQIAAIEEPARGVVLKRRGSTIPDALPAPDARWSFEGDARDGVGHHHGELLNGAVIRNGRLILDGVVANMRSAALEYDIHEKTLEAWVSLANHQQRGGGVIGLDTPEGRFFDSIVFGELKPKHWLAGSDFFNRTQEPAGIEETSAPDQLIHVAIAYAKDNSITLYRNGERYGVSYQKGTLRPFLKGQSRFLFGQRLSDINPPLAGEIEEARCYRRALTAAEVAQSYRAGPSGVTAAEIVAALSPTDREQLAKLQGEREQLQREQRLLQESVGNSWKAALDDARTNQASPLHLWQQLTNRETNTAPDTLRERWQQLSLYWDGELKSRREFNQTRFQPLWDLSTADRDQWSPSGTGLDAAQSVTGIDAPPDSASTPASANRKVPATAGDFNLEITGERIVRGLLPAAVITHSLSTRHTGVLLSPRFKIETNSISIRALGQSSTVRLVIENYPLGNGGIYPAARLNRDEFGWIRLDTAYRKGAYAQVEFITDATERAFFGAAEIVASDQPELPRETNLPILALLAGAPPASAAELAVRYADALREAVRDWQRGTLSSQHAALLDFFVRRSLVPTTMRELPRIGELVDRYRQLEREIPIPRRAPGVVEASAFNQPLWERGQITRPMEPIPRRGLSLFGVEPFKTQQSGRWELAQQITAPENPLLARVLVNRLWQHLFGQGLVGTVDNFGRLGDEPVLPELLDHLTARFVQQEQWSMKNMVRAMVTSQTWQQSSAASAAARELDPGNQWLSHMPIMRLEAEAIRDSLLATSGQLNAAMFGPGVNVYFVNKTEGGGTKGPLDGERRRSIYQRIRRNAFNPLLSVFDAPQPATTRGRRDVTNVPAQALTLLNDPFIIDQSQKWAAALIAAPHTNSHPITPAKRVQQMFLVALSREPKAEELSAAIDYLAELSQDHQIAAKDMMNSVPVWQDFAQSLFCLKEFIYVR